MRRGVSLPALALALTSLAWSGIAVAAETGPERLARQVVAAQPALVGPLSKAWAACGGADRLCLARHLVEAAPKLARLAPASHQDTDIIRWAVTRPSVRLAGGTLLIDRFGRKASLELEAALAGLGGAEALVVDLRANRGGDIGRMRQVAELLTAQAGFLIETAMADGRHLRMPVRPKARRFRVERVVIGPETASAGLLLAALLEAEGAVVEGGDPASRTVERKVVLAVDHAWRLVVATGSSRILRPAGPAIGPAP